MREVARAEIVGDGEAAAVGNAAGADLAVAAHHVLAVAAGGLHAAGPGAGVDDEALVAVAGAARAGEGVLRPAAALEARLLDAVGRARAVESRPCPGPRRG